MKVLPIKPVGKGQGRPVQSAIEPNAKGVYADLGSQACLKASEGMWAFFGQAKGGEQFVKNALNALT